MEGDRRVKGEAFRRTIGRSTSATWAEVTAHDVLAEEGEAEHAPSYYRGMEADFWFRLWDLRRLVADDTPGVIEELRRLRNTRYHGRPGSLYGGVIELPLIVTRDDGAHWVADATSSPAAASGPSATPTSGPTPTASAVYRARRDDPLFDSSGPAVEYAKAVETELNALLFPRLRRRLEKAALKDRETGVDGRPLDLGTRVGHQSLGAVLHLLEKDEVVGRALGGAFSNADAGWLRTRAPLELRSVLEVRNAAARHGGGSVFPERRGRVMRSLPDPLSHPVVTIAANQAVLRRSASTPKPTQIAEEVPMPRAKKPTLLVIALSLLATTACGGDGGTAPPPAQERPTATSLAKVSGDDQSATVGTELPNALVVQVRDQNGAALGGVSVAWEITAGEGSLSTSSTTTGGDGNATVRWTLGTAAGDNAVRASVSGISTSANFSASGTPGAIAVLATSTEALEFAALEDTAHVAVTAADEHGNTLSNAAVSWSSSDPAVASVTEGGVITARGNGPTTVVASAEGISATVGVQVAQVPIAAGISGGDSQTGPAGEELATLLALEVADANGFGVPAVPVLWQVGSTSGSLTTDSVVTDAEGLAAVGWTLGSHSGVDTAVASIPDLQDETLTFTATATPNGRITGSISLTGSLQTSRFTTTSSSTGTPHSPKDGEKLSTLFPSISAPSGRPTRAAVQQADSYVPGSLIVTYRAESIEAPQVGARAYRATSTATDVTTKIRSRLADRATSLNYRIDRIAPAILSSRVLVDPAQLETVRDELLRDPAVLRVERELMVERPAGGLSGALTDRASATLPSEPGYPGQAWHYAMIDAPEAWSITTGSQDVIVAVVDDGIRFDHPAVAGNLTNDGYDFTSEGLVTICGTTVDRAFDGDGYDPDPTMPLDILQPACVFNEYGSHGLHVAGTIGAAGNDGLGVTGVNWSVAVRPIRVFGIEGSAYAFDVAIGILYAAGYALDLGGGNIIHASPARIINLSIGFSSNPAVLQDAVAAADEAGALLIAAAGNSASSDPSYPAAYPEVLSVSAVSPTGDLASYSNYGSTIDIAAPGGEKAFGPDYGVGSTTWNYDANVPTYQWLQGTSMAAPHVAGVAALLLAHEPSLTATEVRERLLGYAIDLGPAGRDDSYGNGVLNARNSLTRTMSPARQLYARLYDADTGELLGTAPVEAGGSFSFLGLEDGSYHVYAGEDRDGDGLIGIPGRRWGAYASTTATPMAIAVDGAGDYPASFSIGFASEIEPNDASNTANQLPLGGHFYATLSSASEVDYYRIRIPISGTYTFETSAWDGACGYAFGEDTILELISSDGSSVIASNDDIDVSNFQYCSRITMQLSEGTYFLRVTGYYGLAYRVEARAGG